MYWKRAKCLGAESGELGEVGDADREGPHGEDLALTVGELGPLESSRQMRGRELTGFHRLPLASLGSRL
jgi:hypothetical protein